MTRIERLLGAPAGQEVELPVDLIVTDDWTTPALLAPLEALGTERAAVPVVLVRDHTLPLDHYEGEDRERVVKLRQVEEHFGARFAAHRISGRGIQHHVLPASGLLRPGMVVLGNDSHTPTLGAYGVAAFAAQPTTIAAAIHTGRVVLRVPETLRIRLEGRLPQGVSARDASLTLLERLRHLAPTGKALEFCGPALEQLSDGERAVLANATPEAAAVTATFGSAETSESAVAAGAIDESAITSRSGATGTLAAASARPVRAASTTSTTYLPTADRPDLVLDLSEVRPVVARSGSPTDVVTLERLEGTRVDRVFVGTCAGGTFEEIRDFAEALGGDRVATSTIVAPASTAIEERLRDEGILGRLEAAGVTLLPPGCGPCFGFGSGRLADGEVVVVTGNRNGIGRMGSPLAQIHLTSGRSAGETARTGRIGGGGPAVRRKPGVPSRRERPRIVWPQGGNVVRLIGTVSTDDITPSAVPGLGTSSDPDPTVTRRLLFHHLDPSAAERDLRGTVVVADENFGLGSNRASSVRALTLAGVEAVVARSVAPLYAMGARDEGLLLVVLEDDEFYRLLGPGATVAVEPALGRVRLEGGETYREFAVGTASDYELALLEAGGLVPYLTGQRVAVSNARPG